MDTTTVAIAVISAIGSSGAGLAIIRWLNDRPKNRVHAEEVWRRMNGSALEDAEKRADRQDSRIDLCEYKEDLLAELCMKLIDMVIILDGDPVGVKTMREEFRRIRFLKDIPS